MRKSRLSWHKQSRLIELFVAGSTAQLVGVNKTTAAYYLVVHAKVNEVVEQQVKCLYLAELSAMARFMRL